ncbi:hypothetical protein VitviT2T_000279 [Vitis vinifera]|uniref:LOB domain-containing protein 42 n=2 Tax=Vitis vinifera TaxID=29760 RepID=D7T948_VITVI|eukprot:XP_002282586.1 PREDICTED: LOB domain-containing protein 42 [Vitis vinifera]
MRTSCNGCRVLRKACSQDCIIKPCLEWIKNPDFQANATLFLAKFYGRAGLINLINAGPQQLRPAIFRSLLWEACGRVVNPIYGSVGLLWSGDWNRCLDAVDAVLRGVPIARKPSEATSSSPSDHPVKAYDIRHVSKDFKFPTTENLNRVTAPAPKPFKRSSKSKPKPQASLVFDFATKPAADQSDKFCDVRLPWPSSHEFNQTPSHEPSLGYHLEWLTKLDTESDKSKVKLELTLGSGTNF